MQADIRIEITTRDYWTRNFHKDVALYNMEFVDLSEHFDRAQVDEILSDEARLLSDWFSGKGTLDAFEELCEEQDAPEYFLFADIAEPGTAGAVATLNLLGCPTFASCNGHGDEAPHVMFWAKKRVVPELIAVAKAVGVGLVDNHTGIEVFSASRRGLHDFATELLRRLGPSLG